VIQHSDYIKSLEGGQNCRAIANTNLASQVGSMFELLRKPRLGLRSGFV
jgi:hypothetical protein